MKVKTLSMFGGKEALFGLGLSYGKTSQTVFEEFDPTTMEHVADKLAGLGYGHDKFLRMMMVSFRDDQLRPAWQHRSATSRAQAAGMENVQ